VRLDLDPYLFQWSFLSVRWYGFLMALSILYATIYLYRKGREIGLSEDFIFNLVIVAVTGGIIGARLLFVTTNFPQWFWQAPFKVLEIWKGGLSWHGALLGGFLPGWWYCRKAGVDVNRIADWVVPGLAIGYALVRIGNIFNQEVLGRFTEFAFYQWPAQLVGSAIGMVLFIRYFYVQHRKPFPGYQFWSFVFYHQLLRGFFEETVRNNPLFVIKYIDPYLGFGFMTLTQWITLPLMLIAWWMIKRLERVSKFSI